MVVSRIVLASITLWTLSFSNALAQRETYSASTVVQLPDIIQVFNIDYEQTRTVVRRGWTPEGTWRELESHPVQKAFDSIQFKLDSTELADDKSREQLDIISEALTSPDLADRHFLIEGHTCDLGENDYNLDLSARRAEVIRDHLVKQGVERGRLAVLGFGEEEPVVKRTAEDGSKEAEQQRRQNRRVVLRVLTQ